VTVCEGRDGADALARARAVHGFDFRVGGRKLFLEDRGGLHEDRRQREENGV
jgi:hypothetical protein